MMVSMSRTRRILTRSILGLVILAAPFSAGSARAEAPLLTHPDASWSLRLDLPGYVVKSPRILRDRSQVWALAASQPSAVILTATIEKLTKFRQTSECRAYALKKLAAAKKKMSLSEQKDWALAEDIPAEGPAGVATGRTLHAYRYHDNFCIDVQFSKESFSPEDRQLIVKSLDGITTVESSREEMARAKLYMPLSGPSEQVALEAAQRLRARDFTGADGLLLTLCPETRRKSPEGRTLPDCSLRNAGLAEARNINQGRDLATLYWRAGDLLEKDGRPDAAIEVCRKGLDITPDHADIWLSIGQAQRDRNDLTAAAAAFNKSLALRPNDPRTMLWLSTNMMDQGKLVEADALLDRIQKIDPKASEVWLRRGEIQMKRGHYTEAIATFEKARGQGVGEETVQAKIKECKAALAPPKD